MVPSKKIGLAMVSIGGWSRAVAREIKGVKNARLVACFTRNQENRRKFAEEYNCEAKESYESLLADPAVDAVLLMSANHVHREQARAALKAGKHVFIDKPITNTLKEAFDLYRAFKKSDRVLFVGHNCRRLWSSRKIRQIIDSGKLGRISMAESNRSHGGGLYLTPDSWRYHRKYCPGGPLIQLGIHEIDTLQYLLGPIVEVSSLLTRLHTPGKIDDTTMTIYRFKSGVIGYTGSGYCVQPGNNFINVYGTDGRVALRPGCVEVAIHDRKKPPRLTRIPIPAHGTLGRANRDEVQDFVNACLGKYQGAIKGEDGIRALAVVEAAILSNQTGKVVEVRKLIKKYDKKFKL